MFSLFGFEEAVANTYRVAYPFIGERPVGTTSELRACYLDFLTDHQPYMPVNRTHDMFVTEVEAESRLVAAYSHNAALNDLGQSTVIGDSYDEPSKLRKVALARDALHEFRELDDELAAIFDLTIHSIVIRPSNSADGRKSYGGSSSAAMGVIWLSLGPTVTRGDVVEMLLHELTHHLLFIDERNHPHFDYDLLTRPENRAFSAILNLHRPLDKVVHSIVVATELILGRRRFLPETELTVHPPAEKMLRDVRSAYESIVTLPAADAVLRPRARAIIDGCVAACEPIEAH